MSYKQVRDILDLSKSFHRRLRNYYDSVSDDAHNERIKLLLEYISRHEESFSQCLGDYEPQAAEGILNTWLQFVPQEEVQQAFAENEIEPGMSSGEVVSRALALDNALSSLYEVLAEQSSAPRVQELFSSLAEFEQRRKEQLGWTMQDFEEQ